MRASIDLNTHNYKVFVLVHLIMFTFIVEKFTERTFSLKRKKRWKMNDDSAKERFTIFTEIPKKK